MNEYVPMDWTTQESWLKALAGERDLSELQSIQTNFWAHPNLHLLGSGGFYPWVMCPDHEADHLPPSSA
jgi:hypothetical protein